MEKIISDGKWHDVLNALRLQLRRGMNAEVADSMRNNGVRYGINFGVTLPILRQIAETLPKEKELAEVMWKKDVREMKLLAILLLEGYDLSLSELHAMALQSPTLEVSEQLVLRLVAPSPEKAEKLARQLLDEAHPADGETATIPYIILTRMAIGRQIHKELLKHAAIAVARDLECQPSNQLQTYILRAFTRAAEMQESLQPLISIIADALADSEENSPAYLIAMDLFNMLDFLETEKYCEN